MNEERLLSMPPVNEQPWTLGRSRLAISATFGDDFAHLLEDNESLLPKLSSEAQAQLREVQSASAGPKEIKPILLDNQVQAACLLRTTGKQVLLIGAKVGKESVLSRIRAETANQIVLQLMNTVGCPPTDKADIDFLADRLADQEEDTIILIIGFENLPRPEQKKLQYLLGKDRVLKKVPQIYVKEG